MHEALDIFQYTDYRLALRDFHENKCKKKQGWSHATWARKIGAKSPSTLSMILGGSRHPSPELSKALAQSLGLQDRHQEYFSLLVELQKHQGTPEVSVLLMEKLSSFRSDRKFHYLDLDRFSFMSHWYFCAIREMVRLRGFREDALWIARRLKFKVSIFEVREAIRSLLRLGLLKRNTQGKLVQSQGAVEAPSDIPNEAVKRFHEQSLENAKIAVRASSPAERDFYGSIFVTEKEKLPQAKALIRKFHDELCDLLETEDGDTVYQLEVGLFPVAGLKGKGT